MTSTAAQMIEAGRAALTHAAWDDARQRFEAALRDQETPEAFEGLGWALWWLDRIDPSFDARECAYRLYAQRDDARAAARVATFLALDIYDYRGPAVARGWLERARRHLAGHESTAEYGWLALWEGHFARVESHDVETTRRLAREASRIARELGIRDLELLAEGLEGHALVSEGRVEAGMRRLDEATAAAMAGEISDLDAAGVACCFLMHACEQVRDYHRAVQWADRVEDFSRRWRIRPLYTICRVHFAAMLVGRGDWEEAQAVFEKALGELGSERGPARDEAVLFLGELRRRQGRWEDADRLLCQVEQMSLSLYARAAMAFDAGDHATAAALLERALRRAAPDNWTLRAEVFDLLAAAQLAGGAEDEAAEALEALQSLADLVATHYVRGCARHAAGLWMLARGEREPARRALEDAVDHFLQAPAPYEANRVRLDLVRTLAGSGRREQAAREARAAEEAFARLGAARDAARAAALASEAEAEAGAAAGAGAKPGAAGSAAGAKPDTGPLTRREVEILGLVAEGLGDKEIAERLHVSEHTVHRHVSNLMLKLDAPSRAAAVAQAMRRGWI